MTLYIRDQDIRVSPFPALNGEACGGEEVVACFNGVTPFDSPELTESGLKCTAAHTEVFILRDIERDLPAVLAQI